MEQKKTLREKVLERIDKMCLMDDDLMSMVLQHKECMELVLNIILNRNDLKVMECKSQYTVQNLVGRSVRLDVMATDSEGKLYDIEVQRSDLGADPKRARYNSSLIDASCLKKGEDICNLPESYVIFITENDVLKGGLPVYTVKRTIAETGGLFNDGSHILYVNSQIQDETALGKLMRDFYRTKSSEMNYPALSKQIGFYKNGEGVSNMCKLFEDLVREEKEESRVEGRAEGKRDTAVKMLAKKKFSFEDIAELTELTIEEVKELAEKHYA
ncbi:MAG: PD-(D/E)XK nuclease family transposase [[Eubacterium] siraeum]|nr:PD-(D/E)XK nuclease family transposase [[Eubacterium] siraeum]